VVNPELEACFNGLLARDHPPSSGKYCAASQKLLGTLCRDAFFGKCTYSGCKGEGSSNLGGTWGKFVGKVAPSRDERRPLPSCRRAACEKRKEKTGSLKRVAGGRRTTNVSVGKKG